MPSSVFDVSLSTMWAKDNFPALEDFFIAARNLGFARIELNHQINSAMLAGIHMRRYAFSGIHEPCPADISMETLKERDWLISSSDENHRKQGVEAVRRSIDLAKEIGAGTIIVHAGNVPGDSRLEMKLRTLFEAGKNQTDEYQSLREALLKGRANLAEVHLEAVKKSLRDLLDYARRFNILLGLENRYHFLDMPIPDEMGILLELAEPDRLGFVYDVGHAQTLDRLGFFHHEEWLKKYSSRIIGVHLHDVIGVMDHYAPGQGEVDFDRVAAYLPQIAFRTCEIKPSATAEQINKGLKFLSEHGCIRSLPERDREAQ